MKQSRDTKRTILIADDHPLFRKGLRDVISEEKDFLVVDDVSDGDRALEVIEQQNPDVAVLDIDMPNRSGLEVVRQAGKKNVDTFFVILTMHDDAEHFEKAMEIGVAGYVLKDSAAGDIVHCIRTVLAGRSYVSPVLSQHLMKRDEKAKAGLDKRLGLSDLTPTERKILKLISTGRSTRQIADELFISTKTVSAHRSNICVKLSLHGTNALLKFAMEHRQQL